LKPFTFSYFIQHFLVWKNMIHEISPVKKEPEIIDVENNIKKELISITLPENWWYSKTTYDSRLPKPAFKPLPLSGNLQENQSAAESFDTAQKFGDYVPLHRSNLEPYDGKELKQKFERLLFIGGIVVGGLIIWLFSSIAASVFSRF